MKCPQCQANNSEKAAFCYLCYKPFQPGKPQALNRPAPVRESHPASGVSRTAFSDNKIRAFGLFYVLISVLFIHMGRSGWLINGMPMDWFGYLVLALSLAIILFPHRFRDRFSRFENLFR